MTLVAWDIETCSRPEEALSESHRRRRRKESEHQMKKDGQPEAEPTDEAQSKAASLHPMLGWICCISAAAGSVEKGARKPTSWTASSPEEDGLEDLCDHIGVESSKDGFDGPDVAPAVREGKIDQVRSYCERDAVATFCCAQEIVPLL